MNSDSTSKSTKCSSTEVHRAAILYKRPAVFLCKQKEDTNTGADKKFCEEGKVLASLQMPVYEWLCLQELPAYINNFTIQWSFLRDLQNS